MYRSPGQHIEIEFLIEDMPVLVMPVTVVEDREDLIAHYLAAGTRYLRRDAVDGTPPPRVIPPEQVGTVETHFTVQEWRGTHRLILARPGQAHAVFMKWRAPSWAFIEWYVNMQAPLVRTERGFTTEDLYLDIRVAPDRTWTWKDADELELAVGLGRLTRSEADEIWREGERVIRDIEAGAFPFDDSLLDWRPDPGWTIQEIS